MVPHLSLIAAKELVIIAITEHKSRYDHQRSLFPDLEELDRIPIEKNGNQNS